MNNPYDIKIIKKDNAWHVFMCCWINKCGWKQIKFGSSSLSEAIKQIEKQIQEWSNENKSN